MSPRDTLCDLHNPRNPKKSLLVLRYKQTIKYHYIINAFIALWLPPFPPNGWANPEWGKHNGLLVPSCTLAAAPCCPKLEPKPANSKGRSLSTHAGDR